MIGKNEIITHDLDGWRSSLDNEGLLLWFIIDELPFDVNDGDELES